MKKKNQENQDDNPKKKQKLNPKEEGQETEIFADPKYDVTFKMLFGNDENKDILISLLNSLLGFEGDKEIVEVEINSNELPVSVFSQAKGLSGVTSSVDVLCTNVGKQKIAIEMQRQKTKYFLAREQEYMAKLIAGQVKEGEGKKYDEKVLETYIIVIAKDNIFVGNTVLTDQKLFEIDVVPMVFQTGEIFPGNKMYWKFFELLKFEQSEGYKNIDKASPLKEQWLEFLLDCSQQKEEPDRNEIIKKGYGIMEVAKWNADTQALYWKQKVNEQDLLELQELATQEQELAKQEEFKKGEIKGELKGEIKSVKTLTGLNIEMGQILGTLKFLLGDSEKKTVENVSYIQGHINDSEEDICAHLGLLGDSGDFA